MKLSQLFSCYSNLRWGESRTSDVKSICDDSRKVEEGCVFVAVKGYRSDGHDYIEQVCEKGAIALVVEDDSRVPKEFKGAVVKVSNSKSALNLLASHYYGEPAKKLHCIGVTGTNGKTSVCYMLEHILNHFGWITGVMGTVDHHLGEHSWKSDLTTPDSLTLHKRLNEFLALDAMAAVFEVSSHAIRQKRAENIDFDSVVFTNLSRDHLDYHGSMEEYFACKENLFSTVITHSSKKRLRAIINKDDSWGKKIRVADNVKKLSFGQENASVSFSIISEDLSGSRFFIKSPQGEGEMYLPLLGRHNIYNAVAATSAAMCAGVSLDSCVDAMSNFSGVPGRLQKVPSKNLHIFVDYAHTHEALSTVLTSLNEMLENLGEKVSITTVFGCGGDRDAGKRPLMLKAALDGSDKVVLTSDNPRTEDPIKIIDDAMSVVRGTNIEENIEIEPDRKRAIEWAIKNAEEGSIVIIAGKGHEDYQVIGLEKLPFSDFAVAKEIIGG